MQQSSYLVQVSIKESIQRKILVCISVHSFNVTRQTQGNQTVAVIDGRNDANLTGYKMVVVTSTVKESFSHHLTSQIYRNTGNLAKILTCPANRLICLGLFDFMPKDPSTPAHSISRGFDMVASKRNLRSQVDFAPTVRHDPNKTAAHVVLYAGYWGVVASL